MPTNLYNNLFKSGQRLKIRTMRTAFKNQENQEIMSKPALNTVNILIYQKHYHTKEQSSKYKYC